MTRKGLIGGVVQVSFINYDVMGKQMVWVI